MTLRPIAALFALVALSCAHTDNSMSEKPNTALSSRPFVRTNESITGDLGVNADASGVQTRPENKRPKERPDVNPESQPFPPPSGTPPPTDAGMPQP